MATRGCGTTRTTSWCAASSTCSSTPATSRPIPMLEKVTDFASKSLDRSNNLADPTPQHRLLRRAAGVVHAVGESLPRVPADRQSEVQDVRRGVALSRLVEQVRAHVGAAGRARRPRLQPRQHLQQRGDGVRRARRRVVPPDPEERLRLPAADAGLCHRRLRAERAVHGARWQPGPRARHEIRHRRDRLRVMGRIQDGALPDAVHGRGPIRRLDGAAVLQRRRRGASPHRTRDATSTTATTASAAG